MASSSRFVVAVHVLTLLAHEECAVASELIAGSVNTHPVVIRRIIGLLCKAGLVASAEGAGGGTKLTKAAGRVTLLEVFRAVEGAVDLFGDPRAQPNPRCAVGRSVQTALKIRTSRVDSLVERELRKSTIADLLADIQANSK